MKIHQFIIFTCVCFAAAVFYGGCSSADNSKNKGVVFAEDKYAAEHPPAPSQGRAVVVTIADMKFQPDNVTISKGDTLIFENKDMVTHDITEKQSKAWSSGPIAAGASWRVAPVQSADYFCSIHPVMTGKITIK